VSFTLEQWVKLLQAPAQQGDGIYTLSALQAFSGLKREATRKAVQKLTGKRFLIHVGANLYGNALHPPRLEEVAGVLGRPAYVSRESALCEGGLLSQMPLALTCVTVGKTRRVLTPMGSIFFYHVQPKLFFGFQCKNGILWAEPEKALLDWVYLERKAGKGSPTLDELDWNALDLSKLENYSKLYPHSIQVEIGRWRSRIWGT
jgi:predicted transcriptional regulator of viral defense system